MTMFYHHQSQMRDRERRRREEREREQEQEQDSENHNWTVAGPDPKGVEVPEYLTIARNHLANRDRIVIPSKTEKLEKDEPEGFNFITILALAVLFLVGVVVVLIFWKYFL